MNLKNNVLLVIYIYISTVHKNLSVWELQCKADENKEREQYTIFYGSDKLN